MWQKLFPAVARTLKTVYGFDSVPYGNFVDREFPEKGWESDALEARYGSNYVGLRNRFSILDENYSYADFKTRVLASRAFVASILAFTREKHRRHGRNGAPGRPGNVRALHAAASSSWSSQRERLFDVTVKSYEFVKETIKPEDRAKYPPWAGDFIMKKTDMLKDYTTALLLPGRAQAARCRCRPATSWRRSSPRRWPT